MRLGRQCAEVDIDHETVAERFEAQNSSAIDDG
jgi:hypothetical protein